MSATYIVGDVRDTLAAMPDSSVDLILTSPPFLALRSYLPADHPDKHREIGSEPGPAEFLDTLLGLSAEWRRVLTPHGTLAVELGDTYAGGGATDSGWHRIGARGDQDDQPPNYRKDGTVSTSGTTNGGAGWPEAKSLTLIPELYRLGLAYGINPLTGQPSPAGRWKIRNVVRWCRPNPPVGALGDKFRPGTSDMVIACTSAKRYFDLDAVRTEAQQPEPRGKRSSETPFDRTHDQGHYGSNPAGAPPLDWWQVSTEAYAGSHYATWPRKLLTRPILAMCPQRVCTTCGEPSRRIVEHGDLEATDAARMTAWDRGKNEDNDADRGGMAAALKKGGFVPNHVRPSVTTGWTDCGHGGAWRNGIVLDPFAGSGTTLAVATGHGRDAIGIDIDARNVDLARERIGPMWFTDTTLADYAATEVVA